MSGQEDAQKVAEAAGKVAQVVSLLHSRLKAVLKDKIPDVKMEKNDFSGCCETIEKNADVFFPDPELRKAAKVHLQHASLIPKRVFHQVGFRLYNQTALNVLLPVFVFGTYDKNQDLSSSS